MHIKIRLIPLRSNISIPKQTWPRQPEHIYSTQRHHNKQEAASPAKDKNIEKETEEMERRAMRQGEGKKCLGPKTTISTLAVSSRFSFHGPYRYFKLSVNAE